jgi:hypothetical protein
MQFLYLIDRFFKSFPIFIEDLPRILPTKFRFIWPSGFREDSLEINQSETRIAFGGHVCQRIGIKLVFFIKDFPRMLPTKFRFMFSQMTKTWWEAPIGGSVLSFLKAE